MSVVHSWMLSVRAWILSLTAIVIITMGYYVATDRITPFTTDAYVQSFVIQIAPRIDGQVVEVLVKDGARVSAGDPLFRLDQTPYRLAVDRLEASLALARSAIAGLESQLVFFEGVVEQREADLEFAQASYDRIARLAEDSFAAQQQLDQAIDTLRSNTALLTQAKADVVNIQTQLGSLVGEEHSQVAQARAELELAKYNLEQTTVFAAVNGVVDNMQLRPGTFLEAGDYVLTLIDETERWIVANYPENALSVIEPGQKVKLSFFTYPGRIFEGSVIALGSGVYKGQGVADGFLADVENPTAWITLSQRFQVRINPEVAPALPLRVGATARVVVFTGSNPIMNNIGTFWLWVGSNLDYIF
ncbi:MAG: HlyD family secretion protein [Pseudomonadota bacterium]